MHPYLRFHLLVRPEGELRPAAHPGPWDGEPDLTAVRLRRVLGRALVELHCPWGAPRCQEKPPGAPPAAATERCGLAASCPYGVLFARGRTPRPPFALHVAGAPGTRGGAASSKAPVLVELTLFGDGCEHYAWALRAIRHALDRGLGKRRRRWRIESVLRISGDGPPEGLCGPELTGLPTTLEPATFELRAGGLPGATGATRTGGPSTVVELLSPTRLVRDGRLLPAGEPVPFAMLIARLLDRFGGLYGDGASELLRPAVRRELEAAAAGVQLLGGATRWRDVKDYSARWRRELRLGGLVGRLSYDASSAPFVPLLRIGELLHLGKNPTSGCGRIRVTDRRPAAW